MCLYREFLIFFFCLKVCGWGGGGRRFVLGVMKWLDVGGGYVGWFGVIGLVVWVIWCEMIVKLWDYNFKVDKVF